MADRDVEQQLEQYRAENHPSLPSRLDCVYASFVPRSRFVSKGYLYEVRPVGATHIADSNIIDELGNTRFVRSLIEQYWSGADPYRSNIDTLEILMSKAVVTAVVDESESRMFRGDVISFGSDAPTLTAEINFYVDGKSEDKSKASNYAYAADGKTKVFYDEAMQELKSTKGIELVKDIKDTPDKFEYVQKLVVKVGPGFVGNLTRLVTGRPGERELNYLDMYLSTQPDGSGMSISVNKAELGKLIRAFRQRKVTKL